MKFRIIAWVFGLGWLAVISISAQPFSLPTANRAILEPGHEADYFVGTIGKPWTSGTFGCVRSEGSQIHEGIDVKSLQHDKKGEPTDPVLAVANGTVVYVNSKAALSNYGRYVVLRHRIEGIEVYSLYAHLSQIKQELAVGQTVSVGDTIAVMGRSTNTRQGISRERAHLHFELNLLLNDRFPEWFKQTSPGERNDHGMWNGHNLAGLDPYRIFLAQQAQGESFSLTRYIRDDTELCRIRIRTTRFPWAGRYPALIRRNASAEGSGLAGFDIALNFNGIPIQSTPRTESEMGNNEKYKLLSVNKEEQERNRGQRLLVKRGGQWQLTHGARKYLDLLTY